MVGQESAAQVLVVQPENIEGVEDRLTSGPGRVRKLRLDFRVQEVISPSRIVFRPILTSDRRSNKPVRFCNS
jgi:hypothetical protein